MAWVKETKKQVNS